METSEASEVILEIMARQLRIELAGANCHLMSGEKG
jgi:hypothetical protein